jgi:putative FmdB family regulatory protein
MPIYEFYCPDCHTVYNFLAKSIQITRRPQCPRCGRPDLQRQVSQFAISKGRGDNQETADPTPDDEANMERALSELSSEMDGASEDDPRQMARMMRKLFQSTGMQLNEPLEEAMRRMEAGEDPDEIEQDMGDVLEGIDPLSMESLKKAARQDITRRQPPNVDPELYDL